MRRSALDAAERGYLADVESLERAVGPRSLPAMLKSIDHLDQHCETLLAHSELAVLALVPGDDRVLEVAGTARVTDDASLRSAMAMNGRAPHAALVLDVRTTRLTSCPAISAAGLWDRSGHVPVDEADGELYRPTT